MPTEQIYEAQNESALYRSAKGMLSERSSALAESWERLLTWLASSTEVALPWNTTGKRLAANLLKEAHLVGDHPFGDAHEFSEFMESCAGRFRQAEAKSEQDRIDAFRDSCRKFTRRGLRIGLATLPETLHRYCSEWALEIALERMAGDYAAKLLLNGQMSPAQAAREIGKNWNAGLLEDSDRLAVHPYTFATYGSVGAGASARRVAESLALPCIVGDGSPRQRILAKLSYPAGSVENHRFPTVAEAGTVSHLCPAREIAPDPANPPTCVGWTKPVGEGIEQPELIHDNASLSVLSSPVELVGSFFA